MSKIPNFQIHKVEKWKILSHFPRRVFFANSHDHKIFLKYNLVKKKLPTSSRLVQNWSFFLKKNQNFDIPKNQWEKLNRFHYCQISKFWFFWKGPTLDGSSTRTTKSPIRGKHWVLIGCRALLGSVRPFMLKLLIFCNFRLNIFNTIVYPNTGYNGRCFLIMLIACMFFLVFSFLVKGQLIPKCLFGVFKSTKNQQNFCMDFCPSL